MPSIPTDKPELILVEVVDDHNPPGSVGHENEHLYFTAVSRKDLFEAVYNYGLLGDHYARLRLEIAQALPRDRQIRHIFFEVDDFPGKKLLATKAPGQAMELIRLCCSLMVTTRLLAHPTASLEEIAGY